nr:reverse transcriptase domain-containing protein [Tanacetum cinerariifolium]
MSAMTNTTPIVTTVTKPATNPRDADATPRVNIQDFCEEYYEDILLIIMDKVRRDKRKEVMLEIHNIKQKDGETIEDFMKGFKVETERMKGAPECMRISRFMHGVNNPELTKRLNEHVSKTMEEMMITTTAFIRGEAATASKKKEAGKFQPSPPMVTPVEKRSNNKFCAFHNDKGHNTDEWSLSSSLGTGREDLKIRTTLSSGHQIPRIGVKNVQVSVDSKLVANQVLGTYVAKEDNMVKSLSPYNGIIGRPGIREIQAVPSTAHEILKFPVDRGIVTIRSTILIPAECTTEITSSAVPKEVGARPENFKVALHPDFPDQEVAIGGTLSAKGRTELCSILKNLDIFAWQPSDMTGRLVDKAFDNQIGRNIEVYIDDLVVKSHTEAEMLRDIDETFRTLRKINMKLNPKKCTFGAEEGVFLGYVVTPEGIKPLLHKSRIVRTETKLYSDGKASSVTSLRSQETSEVLADFLTEIPDENPPAAPVAETQQEPWTLFTDGSSCPFPEGTGKVKFLIVAMDYLTKWIEAKAVATITGSQEGGKKAPHQGPIVRIIGGNSLQAVIPYAVVKMCWTTPDGELRLNLDLLEERRKCVVIHEAKAKLKMTKYYNARVRGVTFRPGDFVYHSNDASHAMEGGKLGPKWEGPYEVTEALEM